MSIGYFKTNPDAFGGVVYENMLAEILATEYQFNCCDIKPRFILKAKRPQMLCAIKIMECAANVDLWIRDSLAVSAMTRRSHRKHNIAILHHVDDSVMLHKWLSRKITQRCLEKANECDCVVVVSQYWKRFFESMGLSRIELIYNGFDINRFKYTEGEVEEFKARHGLLNKPIVYIGNCQKSKGVLETYDSIKHLDVHLVTSGWSDVKLPVRQFQLDYAQYILLLASSDVVITMSKFLEGWNRTAHEAMLCRTPVIGSGTGGMRELLLGGQQIICEDSNELPDVIGGAIEGGRYLGDKGFDYAKQFTVERFAKQWLSLVRRILNSE